MKNFPLDFLVLGAQKSATTWFFECLKKHSLISMPDKKKEVEYIGGDLWKKYGDQWYFNLFNDCNGVIFGDVSVDYLCNNESPKLLYERFPNLKLIISLRNPVDRAISAYYWNYRKGNIDTNLSINDYFNTQIKNYKSDKNLFSILNRGLYQKQIFNYLEYFHPNQFKIIFYDHIKIDQKKVLHSLYDFLNIRAEKKPFFYNIMPKLNSRNRVLLNLERKYSGNKILVKGLQLLHNMFYFMNLSKKISPDELETRIILGEFYKPHNLGLKKFLIKEELVDINSIHNIKWLCD